MVKARDKKSKVSRSKSKVTRKSVKKPAKKKTPKRYMRAAGGLAQKDAAERAKEIEKSPDFQRLRDAGLPKTVAMPIAITVQNNKDKIFVNRENNATNIEVFDAEKVGKVENMLRQQHVVYTKQQFLADSAKFEIQGVQRPGDIQVDRPLFTPRVEAASAEAQVFHIKLNPLLSDKMNQAEIEFTTSSINLNSISPAQNKEAATILEQNGMASLADQVKKNQDRTISIDR